MAAVAESPLVVFGQTKNGEISKKFYQAVLGLKVLEDTPFALVLQGQNAVLRIQKVQDFTPQPFTVLGWEVKDIDQAVDELRGKGVTFEIFEGIEQNEQGIWRSPSGARVAWFRDPDGNLLSISVSTE